MRRLLPLLVLIVTGCAATTSVDFSPAAPASSVCQAPGQSLKGLIVWDVRWRPDQKEPETREAMAEQGIGQFAASSGCFSETRVQRGSPESVAGFDRVVSVTVRELGPVLKLFSSAALVDGGTEVVVDIAAFDPGGSGSRIDFSLYWRNGGHGVVKGVASLSDDMASALVTALRPARIR